MLVFPPYRLDTETGVLERPAGRVTLRPKAQAMLVHLAERAPAIVSREELLECLWADAHVDGQIVKVYVRELRLALGDDPRAPEVIETVRGRGYRFIARVERPAQPVAEGAVDRQTFVGRAPELAQLRAALERAASGERQIAFISGDPGIGKTALVEEVVRRARAGDFAEPFREAAPLVGIGRCPERRGEPFSPLVDCLGSLCSGPGRALVASVLRRHAPSWLAELPGVVPARERDSLARSTAGVTRAGRIREITAALEVLSERFVVVLVLDDLQWSDDACRDVIHALASSRRPAHSMLLGTFRPGDALLVGESMSGLALELCRRGAAEELALGPLAQEDVGRYLEARFDAPIRDALRAPLWLHTGGVPLFVHTAVEQLVATGAIVRASDGWALDASPGDLSKRIPATLNEVLGEETRRLPLSDQRLLEGAATVGARFSAAAAAAACERGTAEVEDGLEALATTRRIIRRIGVEQWPDGSEAASYEFRHSAYRDVLYDAISPARRRSAHARVAKRVEAAWAGRCDEVAAELAEQHEGAADWTASLRFRERAGRGAMERHAYGVAIEHLTGALRCLDIGGDSTDHHLDEIRLRSELGVALMNTRGFAHREVEQNYARALSLCDQVQENADLFPVLEGLQSYYAMAGPTDVAYQLSTRMTAFAERSRDPVMCMEAGHVLGTDLLRLARIEDAARALTAAIALYDDDRAAIALRWCGHDTRACCQANLGVTRWFTGAPDEAIAQCEDALAQAQRLAQPATISTVRALLIWMYLLRGEADPATQLLYAHVALTEQEGQIYQRAMADFFRGWAELLAGRPDDTLAALAEGQRRCAAIGPRVGAIERLMVSIGAHCARGDFSAALECADEVELLVEEKGDLFLRGDVWLLRSSARIGQGDVETAEQELVRAHEFGRANGLRPTELRAAALLSYLWEPRGEAERRRARNLLAVALAGFTDGKDVLDVVHARARLEHLDAVE